MIQGFQLPQYPITMSNPTDLKPMGVILPFQMPRNQRAMSEVMPLMNSSSYMGGIQNSPFVNNGFMNNGNINNIFMGGMPYQPQPSPMQPFPAQPFPTQQFPSVINNNINVYHNSPFTPPQANPNNGLLGLSFMNSMMSSLTAMMALFALQKCFNKEDPSVNEPPPVNEPAPPDPLEKASGVDKINPGDVNGIPEINTKNTIAIDPRDIPKAEFDSFLKNNISQKELSMINPEDLEKVDREGNPVYMIAKGDSDNQYHIYKQRKEGRDDKYRAITKVKGGSNNLYLKDDTVIRNVKNDDSVAEQKWAEYDSKFATYENEVNKYNEETEKFNEEAQKYNKDAKTYNKEMDKYYKQIEKFNKAAENYNKQIEEYNKQIEEYNKNLDPSSEVPTKPEMPGILSSPPAEPTLETPNAPDFNAEQPAPPQAPLEKAIADYKIAEGHYNTGSPLILDTDKDGKVEAQHGIGVDIDGDGNSDGAAIGGDKMLVMGDLNNNGKIDGSEVFGNETVNPFTGEKLNAENGFEALGMIAESAEKITGQKIIENGQVNVKKLEKALEANNVDLGLISGNNISELEDLGSIAKIGLGYETGEIDTSSKINHLQLGSYVDENGEIHKINDVWFQLA